MRSCRRGLRSQSRTEDIDATESGTEVALPKTRRAILKAAGALSALAALPMPAQTPAPAAKPTPEPAPAKKPEGLARVARERYGKFLSEDEMARMDEDMAFLDT